MNLSLSNLISDEVHYVALSGLTVGRCIDHPGHRGSAPHCPGLTYAALSGLNATVVPCRKYVIQHYYESHNALTISQVVMRSRHLTMSRTHHSRLTTHD